MAKSDKSLSITVSVDPKGLVPFMKTIRENQARALDNIDKMIANMEGAGEAVSDPEIFIIDAAALPAEYYLRESVQAAILDEIRKDYANTNQLPAGASLKNEVEARSGETQTISDQKNDSVEPGAGSEDPERGPDNGSETGGGDSDISGQPGESNRDSGSESGKGPSQ